MITNLHLKFRNSNRGIYVKMGLIQMKIDDRGFFESLIPNL